jgi:hypothetical protein
MGASLEVRQTSVRVRQGAPLLRLAKREANARTKAAKDKVRAEQPARLEAYVDAVVAWCNIPKRRRKKTPTPNATDFGITNETRAINGLFRSEKMLALINGTEPREMLCRKS